LKFPRPRWKRAKFPLSVRYSDIDGNDHVNNTAYLDFIQTALVKGRLSATTTRGDDQFAKKSSKDRRG